MSIIIIAFPAAPKVDPEAVKKDEELNQLLKQKVTGLWDLTREMGCFLFLLVLKMFHFATF